MTDDLCTAGATATIIYRGTSLGQAELAVIQNFVDSNGNQGLKEVARRVCTHFGWSRPNGKLPAGSCYLFLRRLGKCGQLRLPERRASSRRRQLPDDRTQILESLGPVAGMVECQPSGPLTVRPIASEEYDGFRLHLQRYHYLGFQKPAGESICYAALLGSELVALLVWGAAVRLSIHRDRFIGWDAPTRERQLLYVVNNSRFLLLPWIRQPHLASRILGANARRLSRDWVHVYGHPIWLAETFVDVARFQGTCYRASNWQYLGLTRGFSRSRHGARGFIQHGQPKAVFVLPLHRRALALLGGAVPAARPGPCLKSSKLSVPLSPNPPSST